MNIYQTLVWPSEAATGEMISIEVLFGTHSIEIRVLGILLYKWRKRPKFESKFWKEILITGEWKGVVPPNYIQKIVHISTLFYQSLSIICSSSRKLFKGNEEYLQHDKILTLTPCEPLILCLSCSKWSCGTYQNCWKEWNAVIRQRCYRESTYFQSTDTERHMWDSINCTISAEWRTQKLWSCFNFKFYKY